MAKILIIEDEKAIRFLSQRFLEMEGFDVSVAKDAETGLGLFSSGSFDLVISDLNLPDCDGVKAISKMQKQTAKQSFLIMSGNLNNERLNEVRGKGGIVETIAKPFELSDFVRAVKSSLKSR